MSRPTDLSPTRIAAATEEIDPVFLGTPQFLDERLSAELGREVVVKVDDIVLVDDDDLRAAQRLVAQSLGLLVEPAGAAGVAALVRHRERLPGGRVAVLLTGAATPPPGDPRAGATA
jgi:threonine dehydratase